ncbi:MAG: DUF4145 domain-containing protein [Pseudomonadota bacterium]
MHKTILHDCPHCGARQAGFQTASIQPIVRRTLDGKEVNSPLAFPIAVAFCGVCTTPVLFQLEKVRSGVEDPLNSLSAFDVRLAVPEPEPEVNIRNLPENVKSAFREAERGFEIGIYSSAAIQLRRALERAIRHINPDASGNLYRMICQLEGNATLPPSMIEWAHAIRLFGNESAHGENEEPSASETADIREFTHLFLRYVFEMPHRVEAARQRRDVSSDG